MSGQQGKCRVRELHAATFSTPRCRLVVDDKDADRLANELLIETGQTIDDLRWEESSRRLAEAGEREAGISVGNYTKRATARGVPLSGEGLAPTIARLPKLAPLALLFFQVLGRGFQPVQGLAGLTTLVLQQAGQLVGTGARR